MVVVVSTAILVLFSILWMLNSEVSESKLVNSQILEVLEDIKSDLEEVKSEQVRLGKI